MTHKSSIKKNLAQLSNIISLLNTNKSFELIYNQVFKSVIYTIDSGNRVFLCGNGGSASDCNHIAAELSGKFLINRDPLPVESLTANQSYITAVGNDFGYEKVFARLVGNYIKKNDLLICISTSGKSKNIINAISEAKKNRIKTITIIGGNYNNIKKLSSVCMYLNFKSTPRIQEIYLAIFHSLCEDIENYYFK